MRRIIAHTKPIEVVDMGGDPETVRLAVYLESAPRFKALVTFRERLNPKTGKWSQRSGSNSCELQVDTVMTAARASGWVEGLAVRPEASRRRADPQLDRYEHFLKAWFKQFNYARKSASDVLKVIEAGGESASLKSAIEMLIGEKHGARQMAFGILNKLKDRDLAGLRLKRAGGKSKTGNLWYVETV